MILRPILTIVFAFSISPFAYSAITCPNNKKIDLEDKMGFKNEFGKSVFQVIVVSDGSPRKEETIGTATLVSNEGYLLTAAHIFETDKNRIQKGIDNKNLHLFLRIPVDESNHESYRGSYVKKISKKFDLSIIKLSDWNAHRRYSPVWLDVKSNPHDYEARLMGYIASERFPTVSEKGNIIRTSRADGYLRATSLSAYQGYSGSLLITEEGMGIAVLSGSFVKDDDENITWSEIGDMENGALNATPLRAVIEELSNLNLKRTKDFVDMLKKSTKTILDYEMNDFIKHERLAAIALAFRLKEKTTIKMPGLGNRENKWKFFLMAQCLMPSDLTQDIFDVMNQQSVSIDERNWFTNEVVKYALNEARETKDIEYSLDMFALYDFAADYAGLDEAYMNYAYLDYYRTTIKAKELGIQLPRSKFPSAVIGTSLAKISKKDLESSNVSKPISESRTLLLSAATAELNKKRKYYDGQVTAKAALKTTNNLNKTLLNDWYFMNAKAINSVQDREMRNALKNERKAVNMNMVEEHDPKSLPFYINLDEINAPSNVQLLGSVKSLGTIQ